MADPISPETGTTSLENIHASRQSHRTTSATTPTTNTTSHSETPLHAENIAPPPTTRHISIQVPTDQQNGFAAPITASGRSTLSPFNSTPGSKDAHSPGSTASPGSDTDNQHEFTIHPGHDAGNALKLDANEQAKQDKQCRFMARNGRYLVKHKGKAKRHQRYVNDFFTTFVDMKWRYTLLSFALFFIVSWLFFAAMYFLIETLRYRSRRENFRSNQTTTAPQYGYCVANVAENNTFTAMFLFSLETQTTIGYGYRAITANCPEAILLLIIQSVVGCLIDAFTAGYIIAKFSRPKKRAATLLFSKQCIICQRDGKLCLMFRVGNLRKSLLVEATIRMLYIAERRTQESEFIPLEQRSMALDLGGDSEKILLVTPQIVCHPIDSSSPLYRLSEKKLHALASGDNSDPDAFERFEIIVVLEGQVESTGMTMQARVSYVASEIKWGYRFENILDPDGGKAGYKVNFQHFNQIQKCKIVNGNSAYEIAAKFNCLEEEPDEGDSVHNQYVNQARKRGGKSSQSSRPLAETIAEESGWSADGPAGMSGRELEACLKSESAERQTSEFSKPVDFSLGGNSKTKIM